MTGTGYNNKYAHLDFTQYNTLEELEDKYLKKSVDNQCVAIVDGKIKAWRVKRVIDKW